MVELYLATGRYEAALDTLSRIAPAARSRPQYQAQFYTQKGLALKGLGRRQEAYAAFLEAINTIEELRGRTSGERTSFFEAGMLSGYFLAYRGMVEVLAEMAQKGEVSPPALQTYGPEPGAAAFYFAESIKARSLLESMAAGAAQASLQLPSDLAARERSIKERLGALEAQREELFLQRRRGKNQVEQPVVEFKQEMEALQREQQQLVEELRRRDPRYAALRYPQPYKARELPLKPGEVLLEYALGEKQSYLFRVESGGKTQVFRLPFGQEALEKRLSAVLAPFRQSVLRREDLSRFSVTEAAGLYRELLEPALSGVAPGTRLIIVPDGVLGAFPFEALVVDAKGDWSKSALVGDRWPVTYSQSAAILALNRILGASKAPQPFFALGDCIYEKESPRYLAYKANPGQAGELRHAGPEKALTMSVTGARGAQLKFPPLPETRKTVEDLASLFGESPRPPQVLLDVQATETRVRQTPLGQYRYLFFGTHGFLADNLAGVQEPTLVLTQVENKSPDNGFLTFSKVLRLKLDADVVTLAACMTGVGQVTQGEGVLNFARAFQQAGARSVMVTLWNIPVEESLNFYSTFYKALKEGKTKLQALQTARQAVRVKEPHPYFWSGIILHGEG
jgi:CHAT domain-containing protein